MDKGLPFEDAIKARDDDIKRLKRKEKRAQRALAAKEAAEQEAAAAAAVADAIAQYGLMVGQGTELSAEETEILEAFDYLTDEEFQEFMELAGLTLKVVDAIRAKEAALSISKVTKDIQSVEAAPEAAMTSTHLNPASEVRDPRIEYTMSETYEELESENEDNEVDQASAPSAEAGAEPPRRTIPHMTSMDLLFKHASVIGDANLRLYPTRPSSPTISDYESDSMHGGLLSRAASVMRHYSKDDDDNELEHKDDEDEDEEPVYRPVNLSRSAIPPLPLASRPTMVTKTMIMSPTDESSSRVEQRMMVMGPQPQANNSQHKIQFNAQSLSSSGAHHGASAMHAPTRNTTKEIETVEYTEEYYSDEDSLNETADKNEGPAVVETEEEAELRELLESMSEEERSEFLRLSKPESLAMGSGILVLH